MWALLCLLASGQSGIVTRIGAAPETLKSRAAANSIFTSISMSTVKRNLFSYFYNAHAPVLTTFMPPLRWVLCSERSRVSIPVVDGVGVTVQCQNCPHGDLPTHLDLGSS